MDILCVTVNTAIDKTCRIDRLRRGEIRKPYEIDARAGGKGVNVARVLAALGVRARHLGTAGGANGAFIAKSLRAQRIAGPLVPLAAESRLCLTFLDDETRSETVLNEPGGPVTRREVATFRDAYRTALAGADLVVLSGSLPRGAPDRLYADLIDDAAAAGIPACLDASGEAFRIALDRRPALVAPNEHELRDALGLRAAGERGLLSAARTLLDAGVGAALVKRGAAGALYATPAVRLRAVPPAVEAISPIGSGDAFLAGFLAAGIAGAPPRDRLALATACGADNATRAGAGIVDPAAVRRLAERVVVDEI